MNSPLDKGRPDSDARAFRRSLGQFATGVTVITTECEGVRAGVTANSFSSLSLEPPLVLWSIARTSRSFNIFQKSEHFVVNILATDQINVSQQFASSCDDKYAGIEWEAGYTGMPVLKGVVGYLECSVEARHSGGDHILLIGRVEQYARFDKEPLLFAQGRYAIARDHPAVAPMVTAGDSVPMPQESARLPALIYNAHYAASVAFGAQRQAEGLSFAQGMIVFALSQSPTQSTEQLAQKVLLPMPIVIDECRDLIERGIITNNMKQGLSLTEEGLRVREAINRRAAAFESAQLEGIPLEDIAAARNFLEIYTSRIGSVVDA